jgi:uncharacterized membrane protein
MEVLMSRSGPHSSHSQKSGLARFLGWFSFGLGVPQLLAPRAFTQGIGAKYDDGTRAATQIVGVREIVAGAGILASRRPAPWLWARVGGDVMDLALLGAALRSKRERPERLGGATAFVVGALAADLTAALRHSRTHEPVHAAEEHRHVRAAITVWRPREEVVGFWETFEHEPSFIHEDGALVRFAPSPDQLGTEITFDMHWEPPLGTVGDTVAKLFGAEPEQQVEDDLRRFKQVMETGEVIRSDGSPEGPKASRLLRQRPAQPLPAGSES